MIAPGVTEARAFARRFAADVGDHRLGDFSIANHLRQFLFLRRTDLAEDHDRFCQRISFKHQRGIGNANAENRVAADVRDRGDPHASLTQDNNRCSKPCRRSD